MLSIFLAFLVHFLRRPHVGGAPVMLRSRRLSHRPGIKIHKMDCRGAART